MDAHGISQNKVDRRTGVNRSPHLEVTASRVSSSPDVVLARLHGVCERQPQEKRVMPTWVQVMRWWKGR